MIKLEALKKRRFFYKTGELNEKYNAPYLVLRDDLWVKIRKWLGRIYEFKSNGIDNEEVMFALENKLRSELQELKKEQFFDQNLRSKLVKKSLRRHKELVFKTKN